MVSSKETVFFKAREVAALLGVDPKTVYTWVAEGKIAHARTPGNGIRIRGSEVDLMLDGKPCLGQEGWLLAAQQASEADL